MKASIFLAISIVLLGVLNSATLVSGDDYPSNSITPQFPFINKEIKSISWSNSSQNYIACAWEDSDLNVNVGLINKSSFTIGKNFSFAQQIPVTFPPHFSIDALANPVVDYLDNGTIILILIMYDAFYNGYNGILEMRKVNMSASWTTPYYLSVPGTLTVSNMRLVTLNSSACAVFWEENNSLVYRILNSGYPWSPKQFLLKSYSAYNFCYRSDGSLTMIEYFSSLFPHAMELPKDPANWSQAIPFRLNYEVANGESTFVSWTCILTFQNNRYLYDTGIPGANDITFYDRTMNESNTYRMQFNSTGVWIVSLFKVDSSRFIVFFNDNGNSKSYYQFVDNINPFPPKLDPITIFIIIIVAILGVQVILFYISKKRKKSQLTQGQGTDISTEGQDMQSEDDIKSARESSEEIPYVDESEGDADNSGN